MRRAQDCLAGEGGDWEGGGGRKMQIAGLQRQAE